MSSAVLWYFLLLSSSRSRDRACLTLSPPWVQKTHDRVGNVTLLGNGTRLRGGENLQTDENKKLSVVIDRKEKRIKILDWRGVEVSWNSGFPRQLPRLEILEVCKDWSRNVIDLRKG